MSINKVVITGNLTRDPELRQTAGGTAVLGLGVAVNDRTKNQQTGEWEDRPNFVDCTMFGNRAQAVSGYLHKGTKVAIEGKLRWSQWERDGQKRSKLEVIVDEIEFMSPRQDAPQQAYAPQQYRQPPQQQYAPQQAYAQQPQQYAPKQAYAQQPQQPGLYDADIPF
jgi:single-strand DNA-binding protein